MPPRSLYANDDDSFIALTTVGWLIGAASVWKVVPKESMQLNLVWLAQIGKGQFGNPDKALSTFNNAKQLGIRGAADQKLNCVGIGDPIIHSHQL